MGNAARLTSRRTESMALRRCSLTLRPTALARLVQSRILARPCLRSGKRPMAPEHAESRFDRLAIG
jgi:hypothetical protein